MRILMVSARYYPFMGGIETHIHEVGPRLAALGHSVDALTTDPSGTLPHEELVKGMRVRRVRAWPKHRDYHFAPGVMTEILRGSWDIIHFQGWHTFVAPLGLLAAVKRDLPFVLTFHSGGHSSRLRNAVRSLQRALLKPLIARADRLIGVSEFEADFFSSTMGIPRDRFAVVPNGTSTLTPSPGVRVDPNLIISVGRLERYKGHHRVIEAMPELLRRVPGARLKILGAGPYEAELKAARHQLCLTDVVTIEAIPGAERQRLADTVASAGLLVLLSEYEAHPVAVIEALSLGRPALVSDTSGTRELAQKGLCRAIPLDATPVAIADALAEELRTPRSVPAETLPNWDDCAQALLDVYHSVTSRPVRRPNSSQPVTIKPVG
ncbi:glycosyltransferase family 4 protein [Methylobacterium nodulans]|uniref:Glycosyl transferase group 1 n=1 Tax=Methylobacterium nodulans (strain LMG 21967 / CNCM I-2342 / ORS 2060) TaxID=460265 RepID=B8IHF3_METNO|nr:glycosyltransferase family 4 protein [Methylobacterium nodulans]ACL61616.1 glycosyl transferase group 1 [Methylobacterium nodulans ORS 2060]